jgi:hypothetical protein
VAYEPAALAVSEPHESAEPGLTGGNPALGYRLFDTLMRTIGALEAVEATGGLQLRCTSGGKMRLWVDGRRHGYLIKFSKSTIKWSFQKPASHVMM